MVSSIGIKTTAAVFAFGDHAVLRAAGKLRRLSFHGLAVRLFLVALPVLALLRCQLLLAQGVCPVSVPPSVSHTLNVPGYQSYRAPVSGDYVTIEYNAKDNTTTWSDYNRFFDYRRLNNTASTVAVNGSFLPVIQNKEKIAVRVCGLHFTDVLTVTTGGIGVPEGGADIRGAAQITPAVSLSSTLDTLQSGVPSGGTTTLPGLGLNAPGALPSLTITGVTAGALGPEDQSPGKYPTYTPATITASGKQVALMLYSVDQNAAELLRLINRTFGEPYDSADYVDSSQPGRADISKAAPGSVNGVMYQLGKTLPDVEADSTDPANFAAFDRHLTDIQNVNAQVSTLSSALSSQAFASNALALLNNYSSLTGILELARLGFDQQNCQNKTQPTLQPPDISILSLDDLKKLTLKDFGSWTPSQIVLLNDGQIGLLSDKPDPSDPSKRTTRAVVTALRKTLTDLGVGPAAARTGDQPLCSVFEQKKFEDFWKAYTDQFEDLSRYPSRAQKIFEKEDFDKGLCDRTDHKCYADRVGKTLVKLKNMLDILRAKLRSIDMATTKLYVTMNEWQSRSSVEETDLLAPLTSNALVRISIAVQRGYTPFTLANAGGAITPAISANVVPTTAAAASTSTPAHSVKTILVEVHRVANFNLMGGTMFIHIPTASYGVQASPTPAVAGLSSSGAITYTGNCSGQMTQLPVPPTATATSPAPAYSCIVQTQQTQWQLAGMVGLVWFPWGHDYFPRHSGYANFGRNLLPSMLLATSVTSLGNSIGGVNWEPVSGLDFYAGVGSAHRTVLPSALTVNTALPSMATITTLTQEHAGLTLGVGFDLNVITTLFSSKTTSVASMP